MAHFISSISKMLDWNHAERPPRQRLRSSRVLLPYSPMPLFYYNAVFGDVAHIFSSKSFKVNALRQNAISKTWDFSSALQPLAHIIRPTSHDSNAKPFNEIGQPDGSEKWQIADATSY